jgi:hypothetical protein
MVGELAAGERYGGGDPNSTRRGQAADPGTVSATPRLAASPPRSVAPVNRASHSGTPGRGDRRRGRGDYGRCRAGGGPAAPCRLAGLVVSRRMDPHATRPALEGGRGAPVRDPGRARTGATGGRRDAGRRCRRSTTRSHGRNRREGGPSTGGRNSRVDHRRTVREPPGSGRPPSGPGAFATVSKGARRHSAEAADAIGATRPVDPNGRTDMPRRVAITRDVRVVFERSRPRDGPSRPVGAAAARRSGRPAGSPGSALRTPTATHRSQSTPGWLPRGLRRPWPSTRDARGDGSGRAWGQVAVAGAYEHGLASVPVADRHGALGDARARAGAGVGGHP